MQHLNEEQLILHHYHDDESPTAALHLATCNECRAQLENLERVLALVDELPIPDRGPAYGEQVWNRLRWRLGRRERRTWVSAFAAAAVIAIAFVAGLLWRGRPAPVQPQTVPVAQAQPVQQPQTTPERVLIFVVGDHLENSERMLAEVANADSKHELDLSDESRRAAELVASNRIYRQTASQQGDKRIASLLADIEPILVELSHAKKVTPEELQSLQKRIESKGLLFKVRVVSAEAAGRELPPAVQKGNSL